MASTLKKAYVIPPEKPKRRLKFPANAFHSISPLIFNKFTPEVSDSAENKILKDKIREALEVIYGVLQEDGVSSTVKASIVEKLKEDVEKCTPGYLDRLNYILLGLKRPTSIEDFLLIMREGIVDSIARQETNEVHKHNKFFIAAAQAGYGVRPISRDDYYAQSPLRASERRSLENGIERGYNGIAALNELLAATESELRSFYGYSESDLEANNFKNLPGIIDFLKQLLFKNSQDKYFDADSLFIGSPPRALDWQVIQELLIFNLDHTYFEFTDEEINFFQTLNYNVDIEFAARNPEWVHYTNLFKYTPYEQKVALAKVWFPNDFSKLSLNDLKYYLDLHAQFFNHRDPIFFQQQISIWLTVKENKKKLASMIDKLSVNQNQIGFVLQFLTLEDFQTLFTKKQIKNIFNYSINQNPTLFITLLDLIGKSFTQKEKTQYLTYDAIIYAFREGQNTAQALLKFIKTLDETYQKFILLKVYGDKSFLMHSMNYLPLTQEVLALSEELGISQEIFLPTGTSEDVLIFSMDLNTARGFEVFCLLLAQKQKLDNHFLAVNCRNLLSFAVRSNNSDMQTTQLVDIILNEVDKTCPESNPFQASSKEFCQSLLAMAANHGSHHKPHLFTKLLVLMQDKFGPYRLNEKEKAVAGTILNRALQQNDLPGIESLVTALLPIAPDFSNLFFIKIFDISPDLAIKIWENSEARVLLQMSGTSNIRFTLLGLQKKSISEKEKFFTKPFPPFSNILIASLFKPESISVQLFILRQINELDNEEIKLKIFSAVTPGPGILRVAAPIVYQAILDTLFTLSPEKTCEFFIQNLHIVKDLLEGTEDRFLVEVKLEYLLTRIEKLPNIKEKSHLILEQFCSSNILYLCSDLSTNLLHRLIMLIQDHHPESLSLLLAQAEERLTRAGERSILQIICKNFAVKYPELNESFELLMTSIITSKSLSLEAKYRLLDFPMACINPFKEKISTEIQIKIDKLATLNEPILLAIQKYLIEPPIKSEYKKTLVLTALEGILEADIGDLAELTASQKQTLIEEIKNTESEICRALEFNPKVFSTGIFAYKGSNIVEICQDLAKKGGENLESHVGPLP